jgi:hypothetical protein
MNTLDVSPAHEDVPSGKSWCPNGQSLASRGWWGAMQIMAPTA